MNVNIETNTTQQVTSAELDELAKNICGVRLTTADDGAPTVDVDSISVDGINATSSDGVYGDTKEALAELGVNVSANVEKLRVLDPEVLRVLLANKTHANEGYFTVLEFGNITTIGDILKANKTITEFTELTKTSVTSIDTVGVAGMSNLYKIDLSNITSYGHQAFGENTALYDVGDITNLISVGARAFYKTPYNSSPRYNHTVLPKLLYIGRSISNGVVLTSSWDSYGTPSLPHSIKYLYCPVCEICIAGAVACNQIKYIYFPKLIYAYEDGSRAFGPDQSSNLINVPCTPDLKMMSVGNTIASISIYNWVLTRSSMPDVSIVLHSTSAQDTSTVTTTTAPNTAKIGHFFLLPEQANSFSLNANFTSYSDSVLIIGSEDWKTQMQVYATDRGYTLPDEYTDFYYEYIDYMLGDVPVPPAHFKSPEQIKIYTKYGELSDNDEICGVDNEVEIILYVDSYRNACTLSLSNNLANASLYGRTLSIPSAANGETVTITATNNYDNTVTASVTIKCYGYMNKAISSISMANQKIILNKLFKQKMYLTLTDLAGLTAIPDNAFNGSALTEADWLLYTNVEIIGENAFYNSLITSVTYPNTIKQLQYRCFMNSKLASVSIPSSIIRIGSQAFNSCTWWNNQSQGFLYVDNWLIGYRLTNTTLSNYLKNNYGQESVTLYTNSTQTTSITNNPVLYTIEPGTIGIAGGVFYNVSVKCTFIDGIKYICDRAFNWYCGDIVLPNSVEYIWNSAFFADNNHRMKSLTLGNGVKYIGDNAFSGCNDLAYNGITSVTIPASIEYIGTGAFNRIWDLGITILATTPPAVSANNATVFYQGNSQTQLNIPIYVPAASLEAYKEAWASLATNVKNRLQAIPTT